MLVFLLCLFYVINKWDCNSNNATLQPICDKAANKVVHNAIVLMRLAAN